MTGKEVIKKAKTYKGDGGLIFCKAYGLNYIVLWCCIFVWFIFKEVKASKLFYSGGKVCNCRTAFIWCKAYLKKVKMKDAKPGDIVFFTWTKKGYNSYNANLSINHIGFIAKAGTSKVAHTIEGNTGNANPSKSKVMERDRAADVILGIFRPKYDKAKVEPENKKSTKGSKLVNEDAKYKVVSKIGSNIRQGHNVNTKVVGGLPYNSLINTTLKYGNWVKCSKGWVCIKDKNGTYLKKV